MTQSVPMNNNIFPSKLNARHVEGFSELRLLSLVTEGRSVCSSAHLPGFLSRVRVCQSVYLSICLPVLLTACLPEDQSVCLPVCQRSLATAGGHERWEMGDGT